MKPLVRQLVPGQGNAAHQMPRTVTQQAAELRQSREVTRALGDYVRSKGLRFYWIPYYTAQGYSEWRDLGFDAAYLQPTYFWNRKIGDERVDRCLLYTSPSPRDCS